MRIGFLISGSLDTLTGGYIYDRQLVGYLRGKGHQVEIISLSGRNYLERFVNGPGFVFKKDLTHLPLDVLLQDELDHPALIWVNRKIKGQATYPIISIVHNLRSCELRSNWQNRLYRQIEKLYLIGVDGFIFNSHTTCQAVENLVESWRPSVIAYPCGNRLPVQITESEIKARAGESGPLRILFLGNLLSNKGLHVLLSSLVRLPENGYFLTAVGDLTMDRAYVRAVKDRIRKYKLNDKVSFTGPLNNKELVAILQKNQVLVVPSFYEGYGIAYLEGMGFGLPAVATTAGAAREIITPGKNGFLIPAGDSLSLSQYLRQLNEDRNLLVSMSLNARQHFLSHPTWQITGERILDFLQSWVSHTISSPGVVSQVSS